MSALASLVRAYDRLYQRGEAPAFGYARTTVRFCVVLRPDGKPAFAPIEFEQAGLTLDLPTPLVQRTSKIVANFLWDKTAYALGVSEQSKRSAKEHDAFITLHEESLKGTADAGLHAFLQFLRNWQPADFNSLCWPQDMKDKNIVFALQDEYQKRYIHERPEAIDRWRHIMSQEPASVAGCLLTGVSDRIARSHPPIKGVRNAQSSGAYIVSYNEGAFTSYGHEQGDNAPVSEAAAFAYTTALNRFLEKGSGHRIQIGDVATVFWANGDTQEAADAEEIFAHFFGIEADDDRKTADEDAARKRIAAILAKIRSGRPIQEIRPDLPKGVRFYVLGLSPNAARLSIRFYFEDDFGEIAKRYIAHLKRMRIEPPPREEAPSMWRLLIETAVQRRSENIAPLLAGEWMRAILAGTSYPLTLLATLIMRIRADHEVNATRAAIIKSVLIHNFKMEVKVSLDPENREPGYLLGRLFAAYEYAQSQALPNLNATIRDKYYGTASATPRAVFPTLQRLAAHHLSKLLKETPSRGRWIDDLIRKIFDLADAGTVTLTTLSPQQQGLFAIGYYHQKSEFYRPKSERQATEEVSK